MHQILQFEMAPKHQFRKMQKKCTKIGIWNRPRTSEIHYFCIFPPATCPKSTGLAIFCPHHVLNIQIRDGLGLGRGPTLGLAGAWGLAKMRSWDVPGPCQNWCRAGMRLPQACPGAGPGLFRMGGWRGSLAKVNRIQSAFRQPNQWWC